MIDAAQLGQVARGLERLAELLRAERLNRTIAGAVSRFRRDMLSTITNYFNDAGELRLGNIREIVSKGIYSAYTEALLEAGIAKDEIEASEYAAMDALTVEQTSFVPDFVKAIRAAKGDADAQDAIKARVETWVQSINAAGTAGLNSAKKNELVEFGGDDGEESCRDCQRLKGTRHRRRWFVDKGLVPGQPGNENFECRGFRCLHVLIPV